MILKGKLTKLSASIFAVLQSPALLSEVSEGIRVFAENAQTPLSFLSMAAASGVIWGGLRTIFKSY